VARPDLAGVRKHHQPLAEGTEDAPGALALVHREVGPRDVADEEAVAGQHGPGLAAAGAVDECERRVLRPVAGRVDRADGEPAQLELPSVVEGKVVVERLGVPVDVDAGSGGGHQAPVTGHVIGVVVGLEDVLDVDAEVAGELQIRVYVELGVDDRRNSGVLVADQVAGAAEVLVDELPEDHLLTLRPGGRGVNRARFG
jgi:hypothetical protein